MEKKRLIIFVGISLTLLGLYYANVIANILHHSGQYIRPYHAIPITTKLFFILSGVVLLTFRELARKFVIVHLTITIFWNVYMFVRELQYVQIKYMFKPTLLTILLVLIVCFLTRPKVKEQFK